MPEAAAAADAAEAADPPDDGGGPEVSGEGEGSGDGDNHGDGGAGGDALHLDDTDAPGDADGGAGAGAAGSAAGGGGVHLPAHEDLIAEIDWASVLAGTAPPRPAAGASRVLPLTDSHPPARAPKRGRPAADGLEALSDDEAQRKLDDFLLALHGRG